MVLGFIKESYAKVKTALTKASGFLGGNIRNLFQGPIDERMLEKLEQLLYEADFGVKTATELTEHIRAYHQEHPEHDSAHYLQEIKKHILSMLSKYPTELVRPAPEQLPLVILVVGVNGNGKTTSVARLANIMHQAGSKILLGGADTFRAAAMEQLAVWADRLKVDIVKGNPKSDPAAVAFDAVQAAKGRGSDVVIIDTAGRLHTKTPLMQELEKIRRTCHKAHGGAPHETLLVLDATTGQNAIDQAKHFNKSTPITGIILTKIDGTAKGGIVVAIQRELGIPVKFIGTGEGLDDMQPFNPSDFVESLFA